MLQNFLDKYDCVIENGAKACSTSLLSGDERDEDDEEHISDDESDDDDDDIPYNPKNLPLGWDGKVSVNIIVTYSVIYMLISETK